jgi:hypothetical protein
VVAAIDQHIADEGDFGGLGGLIPSIEIRTLYSRTLYLGTIVRDWFVSFDGRAGYRGRPPVIQSPQPSRPRFRMTGAVGLMEELGNVQIK